MLVRQASTLRFRGITPSLCILEGCDVDCRNGSRGFRGGCVIGPCSLGLRLPGAGAPQHAVDESESREGKEGCEESAAGLYLLASDWSWSTKRALRRFRAVLASSRSNEVVKWERREEGGIVVWLEPLPALYEANEDPEAKGRSGCSSRHNDPATLEYGPALL